MLNVIRSGVARVGVATGLILMRGAAGEIERFELDSEYLGSSVMVEALIPDDVSAAARLPVVYVLAAEPGPTGNRGLAEIHRLGLANRHEVICVGVNFNTMPWYGDHPSDPCVRHESHLLRRLIPEIDRRYRTQLGREGRWLLGFSKSGWGAWTLLLRHPDVFGYAASWDAPLWFATPDFGVYGTAAHFGTTENFARYLPMTLVKAHPEHWAARARLVLAGSALFGSEPDGRFAETPHTEAMHHLLGQLGIPHHYAPELKFSHRWNSGWLEPTLAFLVALARAPAEANLVNVSNAGTLAHP